MADLSNNFGVKTRISRGIEYYPLTLPSLSPPWFSYYKKEILRGAERRNNA
jgi:hypothetical protein